MITRVLYILHKHGFIATDEKELQDEIERIFRDKEILHQREVSLDAESRIDFMVGDIGIEVKIGGSVQSVIRQLHRYAQFDQIKSLILLTTKNKHRSVPKIINQKEVVVVFVGSWM